MSATERTSSEQQAPARLRARGIVFERGDKAILRGVDVDATEGEVLGVLGPSGAGKSTLFRVLVGELAPRAGEVTLGGEDVTRWPLWRRARAGLGYVPQEPTVLWDLTVRQNLVTFRQVVHKSRSDEEVERAAREVDLSHRLDVRAGELSAGERRRLELARALTRTPRVLICDEPFAGVDPAGAERLAELLRGLAERDRVSVILADHHVAEALGICSRAMLLLDGEVATTGTPDEFRDHPLVRGRYLGSWARSLPPPSK